MTVRKGTTPKGAKLPSETNQWFETKALAELQRLPTCVWENMRGLWNWLPSAHPTTRRRILVRCLELARERGDPLSNKFVKCFAENAIGELSVSKAPRARVHDESGFRAAARYSAHNPKASLSQLARAANAKKGTVRQWKRRPDFLAYEEDEKVLIRYEQEKAASLAKEQREFEHGAAGENKKTVRPRKF